MTQFIASIAFADTAPVVNVSTEIRYTDPISIVTQEKKILDVPYISQIEEYPNGCEAVSTVMALNYQGIIIDVERFVENYLDTGATPTPGKISPDPNKVYMGDPRSADGWGCYSPVIVKALKKFLSEESYVISNNYGMSLSELCYEYVDRGVPVIIWATVNMEDASDSDNYHIWRTADGSDVAYNKRLHCMVLCGYDRNNYYFNDPLTQKAKAYPRDESEKAYSILGMQSVTICKK